MKGGEAMLSDKNLKNCLAALCVVVMVAGSAFTPGRTALIANTLDTSYKGYTMIRSRLEKAGLYRG